MTTPRGTYRVTDGQPVKTKDARLEWAVAARPILVSLAEQYDATISYRELAEQVQAATGVRTTQLFRYWIGEVLFHVAEGCAQRGDPLLTSLVIRADGTIGDGYMKALQIMGQPVPDDIELAAAEERLRCYRHFGAELPANGGTPRLPEQVRKARARRARSGRSAQSNERVCPTCHLHLPATGVCDTCD